MNTLTLVQLISNNDEEGYAGAKSVNSNGQLTYDTKGLPTHSTNHLLIGRFIAHLKKWGVKEMDLKIFELFYFLMVHISIQDYFLGEKKCDSYLMAINLNIYFR